MPTRFHCTRAEFALSDPARFDQQRVDDARLRPDVVVDTVDEAVEQVYTWVADALKRNTDPDAAAQRSGLVTDDDWSSRMDISRAALQRGQSCGRGTRVGEGRIVHAHAYPVVV